MTIDFTAKHSKSYNKCLEEMTPEEKATITDLKKCDFNQMNEYFKAESEARKARSKEEKLK